jgi:hypothetical protein
MICAEDGGGRLSFDAAGPGVAPPVSSSRSALKEGLMSGRSWRAHVKLTRRADSRFAGAIIRPFIMRVATAAIAKRSGADLSTRCAVSGVLERWWRGSGVKAARNRPVGIQIL